MNVAHPAKNDHRPVTPCNDTCVERRSDLASVTCPYCFEVVDLYVDPETEGSFVEDCAVCCRPWTVTVSRDEQTGELIVDVGRA